MPKNLFADNQVLLLNDCDFNGKRHATVKMKLKCYSKKNC